MQVVGQQRHATLVHGDVRRDLAEVDGTVVVADHVERLLVGRHHHAVRLARVGDDPVDGTVRIDAVHGHHGLLHRFVADVLGIAEVDPPPLVDGDVVRGVERPAFVLVGDDVGLARLHVRPRHPPTALVGPFRGDQPVLRVELEAVGHPAGRPVDRGFAGPGIIAPDVPGLDAVGTRRRGEGDVAEVDHPVGTLGGTLGQRQAFIEHHLQLGVGRNELRIAGGRTGFLGVKGHGEQQDDQGKCMQK